MKKVKKFFYFIYSKKLTVINAAVLLGATYLLTKIIGLISKVIIVNKFGAGTETDVYFASFVIPDFVFQLLIFGSLATVFIPVLVNVITEKGHEKARELANNILNIFFLGSLVLSALLFVLAPYIVPYIFQGLAGEAQDIGMDVFDATVNTMRIMLLAPIFLSISGVLSGILNSYKRFFTYSLAPIIYNLSIIFGTLYLTDFFSFPVYGIALGVVIGSFLHMLIQVPELFKTKYRYRPILNFRDKEVKNIFRLMIPRSLTVGVAQINIVVNTIIAAFFLGGISILTYVNDIQMVPVIVFALAIATAIFPYLAESYSKKDMGEFVKSFSWSFRKILFFLVPATFGIIALKAQIIRLIFGLGDQFDWGHTEIAILTLQFFVFSLVAQGLIYLVLRAFYAMQDTKTPLYIAVVAMVVNAVLAVLLSFGYLGFTLGIAGVALAFTVASFLNIGLLIYYLHKKIGVLDKDNKIFVSLSRLVIASGAMFLIIKGSLYFFDNFFNNEKVIGLAFQTISSIAVAAVFYLGLTYLLRCEETRHVFEKTGKYFSKNPSKSVR